MADISEVMAAEAALKPYQMPELPQQVNQAVMGEWSPLLQKAAGQVQTNLQNFLPQFQNIPYEGLAAGTDEASLNPQQKMQLMSTNLGQLAGRLSGSTAYADYLGGKASEMQQRALQAMQFGQQGAADAYSRAFQRYQLALQEEQSGRANDWLSNFLAQNQQKQVRNQGAGNIGYTLGGKIGTAAAASRTTPVQGFVRGLQELAANPYVNYLGGSMPLMQQAYRKNLPEYQQQATDWLSQMGL